MDKNELLKRVGAIAKEMREIRNSFRLLSVETNFIKSSTYRGDINIQVSNKDFWKVFGDDEYEYIRDDIDDEHPFCLVSHLVDYDGVVVDFHTVINENTTIDEDGEDGV